MLGAATTIGPRRAPGIASLRMGVAMVGLRPERAPQHRAEEAAISTATLPDRATASTATATVRTGTALVLTGAVVEYAVTTLHPHREAPNDHARVFAEYAASSDWIAVHLGQFAAGVVVLLAGFLTL